MNDFAFIPGGKINIVANPGDQDFIYPDLNGDREPVVQVQSFYLCKYEVSNHEYLQFIYALQRKKDTIMPAWYNYSKLEDPVFYHSMLPDTNVWQKPYDAQADQMYAYSEASMSQYYFRHPAYSNYPMVGLTWEQAQAFCEFATESYNKDPFRKYKKILFRLPTRAEWEYAASGGYSEQKFPWKEKSLLDKHFNPRANFKFIEQQNILRSRYRYNSQWGDERTQETTECFAHIPDNNPIKPVKSYKPGFFGLYNMAGNVEEMVLEKGLTKGGSWNDTGYYLMNEITEMYDSANLTSLQRGFRMVMEIIEK